MSLRDISPRRAWRSIAATKMEHGVRADIGVLHHEEHEGHEEKNPLEIADRFNGSKSVCSGF
jgi:hypothetical protein